MRKIIVLIALIATSLTGFAQDWQTDFNLAKQTAEQTNKRIILVFQGSDWCAPCIKLDREVWSTDEFKSYATDHFVMLKADFPRKKKNALAQEQQEQNNHLAELYNKNGYFPYVVVLDSSGNVLGTSGYEKKSPKEYIELLESFN
ncbi:thioredoxin family protein [Mangrovimonas aestuarii]|uniref:thioredoxin family protein n=1 Tax=Mangrovimonas aestuarii TaxID=3018443 RepID=UPI002379C36D|nr:thioredoxin family protein [Mangrovimonas aestuarii]